MTSDLQEILHRPDGLLSSPFILLPGALLTWLLMDEVGPCQRIGMPRAPARRPGHLLLAS